MKSIFLKNLHALYYLPVGFHSLAETVRREEIRVIHKYNGKPPVLIVCGFKNNEIIACYFNWFSISLINYIRLIGLIDIMNKISLKSKNLKNIDNRKIIKDYCIKYTKEVVPELKKWRDKVSAHFAITYPFENDNLGTLEASVMNPVSYRKPYFKASALQWFTEDQGSQLPEWTLTKTYEDLCNRYWPNRKISELPEYK